MKKTLAGAALCAALILGTSGAAFAGEVTGNGKPTPARDNAASACAFSGLEDGSEDPSAPSGPGAVQNWGHIPKALRDQVSVRGAAEVNFFGEVAGCNPHVGGEH